MYKFTVESVGQADRIKEELSENLIFDMDYTIKLGKLSLPLDFPFLDMLIYKCNLISYEV